LRGASRQDMPERESANEKKNGLRRAERRPK
jgi:hypothetical protein